MTLDIRMIQLPETFGTALTKLVQRICLGRSDADRQHFARRVIEALVGKESSFGRLQLLREHDLREAFTISGVEPDSITALRETAQLLAQINPQTLVCNVCNEFALINEGGRVTALKGGTTCPGCKKGVFALVPMVLRKIAWTTNALVAPSVICDETSVRGASIPLEDEGILRWSDGWIDRGLQELLTLHKLPLYVFVAYLLHVRHAFKRFEELPEVLHWPKTSGLTTKEELETAVLRALVMCSQREITNEPRLPPAIFLARHQQPDLPTWQIGGRPYLIHREVGAGEGCRLFLAQQEQEPAERVIVKLFTGSTDPRPQYAHEERSLRALIHDRKSEATFEYGNQLPYPIGVRDCVTPSWSGPVLLFRDKPGFRWTLAEAFEEYPKGIPTHAAAWIMKRVLALLSWMHQLGYVHGAITPEHILINPSDHKVTLVGWSHAGELDRNPTRAFTPAMIEVDPYQGRMDLAVMREREIGMACRSMIKALGGDVSTGVLPDTSFDAATECIVKHAAYRPFVIGETAAVYEAFSQSVKAAHGAPRFIDCILPRSSR